MLCSSGTNSTVLKVVASGVLSAAAAFGQAHYDAHNFNTNSGYVRGYSITSSNQPASLRWEGNDPYNIGTDEGETDLVARALGYTPSPLANSSLTQGGFGVADNIFPGTTNVRIWKSFSPSASSVFFVEWSLIPSLESAPYNRADTFAFDLRNSASSQSLLKLQLTPGINLQSNSYTLQVIAAGSPTQTVIDLGYQGIFQIDAGLDNSTWNLSLRQINPSTRAVIASYTNLASGALSSGTSAGDFDTISLDWNLASANNLEPGSNYLIANQFAVVPEPSSTLLLALSGGALLALARYRRET